jgi:serine/threonine-protein kinase HipA
MSELEILIEGELVGRIAMSKTGNLSLDYEPSWRDSPGSYSLSVSMPLAEISYSHRVVWPYLWNLLPENPNILQRWSQQFHVSANNPFKLLQVVGADVPGAAQFFPPDATAAVQAQQTPSIDWISLEELTERLTQLRSDISAVRRAGDRGKMSLPGAQAKTAFCYDERRRRWGIPSGRAPTTHIIKPAIPGFDGLVENEHLCQDIAKRLGLFAARSFVLTLQGIAYIVIERFDRIPPAKGSAFVRRVHQEDMCQALGLLPGAKYQQDGGPSVSDIVALIRRVSSNPTADIDRFIDANAFNWLIGGTDAHAKNYSLLLGGENQVLLSPLYDLSSQLPYPELIDQRVAMSIGGKYDIPLIGLAEWHKQGLACGVDAAALVDRIRQMAEMLPDVTAASRDQALQDGLDRSVVTVLTTKLIEHAASRRAALQTITRRPRRTAR